MELMAWEAPTLGPAARDFIAGGLAGAFAISVSQPLDTARVRLQHAEGATTLQTLRTMLRREGLLSPWKGLSTPLLFAAFQSAILFQVYGWSLRRMVADQEDGPHHGGQEHGQPGVQQPPPQQQRSALALSAAPSTAAQSAARTYASASAAPPPSLPLQDGWLPHGWLWRTVAGSPYYTQQGHLAPEQREQVQGGGQQQQPASLSSSSSSSQHHSSSHDGDDGDGRHSYQGIPTAYQAGVAGAVAGAAQLLLWSPVELIKLRQQLQTASPGGPGYLSPAAMAGRVLQHEGMAGLYRGLTLTAVRDVPSFGLYFGMYHGLCHVLSPGMHPEAAPASTQVLAGGTAGVLAWLPIYPIDVIKTRLQALPHGPGAAGRRGWLHYARELYRESGYRAFFRGASPTLVRAFVMDGCQFLGYTAALKWL